MITYMSLSPGRVLQATDLVVRHVISSTPPVVFCVPSLYCLIALIYETKLYIMQIYKEIYMYIHIIYIYIYYA